MSTCLIYVTQHPTIHVMYRNLQRVLQPVVSFRHSFNWLDKCLHDTAICTTSWGCCV